MNTDRDFERITSAWLADGPTELADRVLDAALGEVHLTHQQRALGVPWRTTSMSNPFRLAVAVIAVVVVGLFALNLPRISGIGGQSSAPPASPSSAPTPESTPKEVTLTAKDFAYDVTSLEVTAGRPFTIHFVNADPASVPHDVDIRAADRTTIVVDQPTTNGGGSADYEYPALEAGTYIYTCSIHPIPGMTGTLTVR